MNPELYRRWCEAMLSGRYGKGRDMARGPRGWTSLGVLLDVIDPSRWNQTRHGDWRWDESYTGPPNWVRDQTGLNHDACRKLFEFDQQCDTFAEAVAGLRSLVRFDPDARAEPHPTTDRVKEAKDKIHRVVPLPKLGRGPAKPKKGA